MSREAFDRKYIKNKEYQKSDKSKLKSHEYYLANKERIKEKRKATNKYKEEHNPLMLLLATARNVSIRRNHNFNLDIEYMYKLWDEQDGKCYYTGIPMIKTFNQKSPYQMSIDRIDSNIGYIKGNVCLCCLSMNFAKNSFSVEEIMKFINDLKAIELCQKEKINLTEILEDFGICDNSTHPNKQIREKHLVIIAAMKEACKQTLELAAENAYTKWNGDYIEIPIDTVVIDKQSILDTINQIE